jgi:ATP-binding cassette subfamily B protein
LRIPDAVDLAFLVILLAILPIIFIGKMLKKVAYQTQNAIASVSAHIEESLNGIQTIQAYLCENREIDNFNQQCSNVLQSSLQKIHFRALLVAFVIAISLYLLLYLQRGFLHLYSCSISPLLFLK